MINCIEYTQKRIVLSCCIGGFVTFGPGLTCCAAQADAEEPSWEMAEGDMVTRWAKEVSPNNALPEYPRPMMRRELKMLKALKTGTNVIAVHCHNEHHPQYIDVGIVDVIPNKEEK
jgi:hypothetical protein